jgi:hypothetical protein
VGVVSTATGAIWRHRGGWAAKRAASAEVVYKDRPRRDLGAVYAVSTSVAGAGWSVGSGSVVNDADAGSPRRSAPTRRGSRPRPCPRSDFARSSTQPTTPAKSVGSVPRLTACSPACRPRWRNARLTSVSCASSLPMPARYSLLQEAYGADRTQSNVQRPLAEAIRGGIGASRMSQVRSGFLGPRPIDGEPW